MNGWREWLFFCTTTEIFIVLELVRYIRPQNIVIMNGRITDMHFTVMDFTAIVQKIIDKI